MEELDAVAVVVGDAHVVASRQDLASLFLQSEEVARLARLAPCPFEDLGGELEHDVGTEVGTPSGSVDACRIGGLEHIVRRPLLPLGVCFLRRECPFVQDDVAAGHTRSRRSIAEVIGCHARVDGGVLELVGEP